MPLPAVLTRLARTHRPTRAAATAVFAYLEPEGVDPCNAGKLYSLWAH